MILDLQAARDRRRSIDEPKPCPPADRRPIGELGPRAKAALAAIGDDALPLGFPT